MLFIRKIRRNHLFYSSHFFNYVSFKSFQSNFIEIGSNVVFMFIYANYNLIQKYVLKSHKKLYYMTAILTILYYYWMIKYKKYLHPIWHIITFSVPYHILQTYPPTLIK